MHVLRATTLDNVEAVTNGRSGGGIASYSAESRRRIISWKLESSDVLENPFDLLRAILRRNLRCVE